MRILSVEELNTFKRDDLHIATLSALEEYDYNSSNYTYPLLKNKSSGDDLNWLSAATQDWDFVLQAGTFGTKVTEPMKYFWFKAGVEANFGRLTAGILPASYDFETDLDSGMTRESELPSEKNVVLQYSKEVTRLGDKGRVYLGGGLSMYSEGRIGPEGESFESKLFGVNAILEINYPIYMSPRFQAQLTGALQLNMMLPQTESLDSGELTITQGNIADVLLGAVVMF